MSNRADRADGSNQVVLVVLAHPDDESLACGGTLARLADAGVKVILICGSRGEKGSVSDRSLVPDGNLAAVRSRELIDAANVLGIAEVLIKDHPDGEMRWDEVDEFHAEIVTAINTYRPNAVITFAEDGLYWHKDHIGVHERTYSAVKSLGAEAPPLYYVMMPKGIMRELVEAATARAGLDDPLRPSRPWGIEPDAFGLGAEPPAFAIDVRDWIPRKLAALRCHKTQIGVDNPIAWIDDEAARRCFGVEYFGRSPLPCLNADSILESFAEPVPSR